MKSQSQIVVLLAAIFSFLPSSTYAGGLKLELTDFGGSGQANNPQGWQTWSPRAELRPRCYVDSAGSVATNALAISGNGNPAEYGGWSYVARRFSLDTSIV
jgi:hypothetical protein